MKSNRNMNRTITVKLAALASVVALALFAGCKKQETHDEHDGHEQKAETASPGSGGATAQVTLSGEKCGKHDAPKEWCFICNANLREPGRLWCKEHDRYEDRCWICHPEAQDKNRLWCKEHSLYEEECFLCHPEVKKKGA